jgi:hypothetical protein
VEISNEVEPNPLIFFNYSIRLFGRLVFYFFTVDWPSFFPSSSSMNSNNVLDDFSEIFSQSLNYYGSCSPDTVVSIDSSERYLMTMR